MADIINILDATNRLISNSNNRNYRERLINLRTRINVKTAEVNSYGEDPLTQEQVDLLLTNIIFGIDN
jgi:predicted protein tyrosine phosphatase